MQTQTTIRTLLDEAGLRPTKRFGQHFLIDGNLMRKLVASAEIRPGDVVLEVGCGTGSLTKELAALAGKVIAVEIDKGLAAVARNMLAECDNVVLIHGDVLEGKHDVDPEVLRLLRDSRRESGGRCLLVANLPYQIASPLVIDLLINDLELCRLCFTVQKEVGDKLLAGPGDKDYGPLSIIVQALTEISRIAAVPPQAFWPRPAVNSLMLRLDPSLERRGAIRHVGLFARLVRESFLHRRKTLAHNLASACGHDVARKVLADIGLDPRDRPEQIAPPQWVGLANRVIEVAPPAPRGSP